MEQGPRNIDERLQPSIAKRNLIDPQPYFTTP